MAHASDSARPAPAGDATQIDRRSLLGATGLLGAGSLLAQVALPSRAAAQQVAAAAPKPRLTVKDVLDKARERLMPTCRVCPECDGVACSGEPAGIGGYGTGASFRNNFTALQRVKLNLRTLTDVARADASTTIYGRKISFPAVAAPMGPAATRFGKGIPVNDWFEAIVGGCVAAGTLGAIGDTPSYPLEEMKTRWAVIAKYQGRAFYTIKPVPNAAILKLRPYIEESGAAWLAMDTDSAGRYNNDSPDLRVGPKTPAELRELVKAFKIPVVVKGIMTPDEAVIALEAGCGGIVVSNHGGRVLDYTPGVAEVLQSVAAKVKGKIPVFADGVVHTGADVLKYVAMGADVVLVGRHILRAAYGAGPDGVALFMNTMRDEFERAMVLTGVPTVAKINGAVLAPLSA